MCFRLMINHPRENRQGLYMKEGENLNKFGKTEITQPAKRCRCTTITGPGTPLLLSNQREKLFIAAGAPLVRDTELVRCTQLTMTRNFTIIWIISENPPKTRRYKNKK